MDRKIVYTNQVPFESDVLTTNLNAYIGLGRLSNAVLGQGPLINNLNCVPSIPPGLSVVLEPGEIYETAAIDPSPYGVLPANPGTILHQGILDSPVPFSTPAPVTPGNSINYLIQVRYQQVDDQSQSRPYFNTANPQNPIIISANSARQDLLIAQIKTGVEATTGNQLTPDPDAGFTGAWVITVNFGDTEVLQGAIAKFPGAPFIVNKLPNIISQQNGDERYARLNVSNIFTQPQNIPAIYASVRQSGGTPQIITGTNQPELVDFDLIERDDFSLFRAIDSSFVPNVPGLYEFNCNLFGRAVGTGNFAFYIILYKNGTPLKRLSEISSMAADPETDTTLSGSAKDFANGTTDFYQIFALAADLAISLAGADKVANPADVPSLSAFQVTFLGT